MRKKIITILILNIILFCISTTTFAIDTSQYKPISPSGYSEFTNIGGSIISVIQYTGIILGAIVLTIIGIKYMLGSVEEKAEYKQTMMPFIVGCVFLMCTSAIVGIIADSITEKNNDYYEYGSMSTTPNELGRKDANKFIEENGDYAIIEKYFVVTRKTVEAMINENENDIDYYGQYNLTLRNYINKHNLTKNQIFIEKNEEHQEWLDQNEEYQKIK